MGKSSKKFRRVKSIDPFYRGPRKNDLKGDNYDRPPTAASKRDIKSSNRPKKKTNSPHEFNKDKKIKQRHHERPPTKAAAKSRQKPPLFTSKLPNESMKKFYDRLDREANDIITEQMKDLKEIRAKRKEHLKARRNKIKEKNKKKMTDKNEKFYERKDEVKFGEVAQQPPRITVKPKKSVEKAVANNLLLNKIFTKNETENRNSNKAESSQKVDVKKRKFRDLSAEEQQSILAERSKAVLAYRQLIAKKRLESKN